MSICLHASRIKLPRGESLKCASVEKLKISRVGFSSRVVVLFTYASIFRFLYRNLRQNWAINPFHSIKRFADRKSLKFATSIWADYNEINFDGVFFVPCHEIFAIEPHAAARITNSISCSAATLYWATRYFVIHSFLRDIRSVNWMHIRHLPHSKWALKCGTHRFVSNTKRNEKSLWPGLFWSDNKLADRQLNSITRANSIDFLSAVGFFVNCTRLPALEPHQSYRMSLHKQHRPNRINVDNSAQFSIRIALIIFASGKAHYTCNTNDDVIA